MTVCVGASVGDMEHEVVGTSVRVALVSAKAPNVDSEGDNFGAVSRRPDHTAQSYRRWQFVTQAFSPSDCGVKIMRPEASNCRREVVLWAFQRSYNIPCPHWRPRTVGVELEVLRVCSSFPFARQRYRPQSLHWSFQMTIVGWRSKYPSQIDCYAGHLVPRPPEAEPRLVDRLIEVIHPVDWAVEVDRYAVPAAVQGGHLGAARQVYQLWPAFALP